MNRLEEILQPVTCLQARMCETDACHKRRKTGISLAQLSYPGIAKLPPGKTIFGMKQAERIPIEYYSLR